LDELGVSTAQIQPIAILGSNDHDTRHSKCSKSKQNGLGKNLPDAVLDELKSFGNVGV